MKNWLLKTLVLILNILLIMFCSIDSYAKDNTDDSADDYMEDDSNDSVLEDDSEELIIDINQTIDITVNLEDSSRFMGISVYKVGEYDGEKYYFINDYKELIGKDYYRIERASDLSDASKVFTDYFKKNKDIEPDARIEIVKGIGKGTARGLPIGVYVIVQNASDCNAEIIRCYLVEAPELSENKDEYLYDIRVFPKWERVIWFSFRPEVVYPLGIGLALLLCLILAMYGMHIYKLLFFAASFLLSGICGMRLCQNSISNYIYLMFIFNICAYLGLGIAIFISAIIKKLIKKKVQEKINKHLFWVSPIIAFVISSYLIRRYLTDNYIFWGTIPAIIAFLGAVLQFLKRSEKSVFYTYDDLLKLKENEIEEEREDA